MADAFYPQLAHVIELHLQVMERTATRSQGIRAQDELESAIARPQMAAHYEGADEIRQATLLAIGISQSQTFVDGYKRAAFAAADVFLDVNGYRFEGDPIEFAKQLEPVAERTDSLDAATDRFEAWLRENTQPYSS